MTEPLTLGLIAIAGIGIFLGLIFWFRRIRQRIASEPIIELEKLVNCKSCGSLIPEGVRKCAFCGAWQRKEKSAGVEEST